ncbi:helicase associated domain-containing protein [Streptomyces sp. NBC_01353]|uniref:helicase associated domain-containing protein n=1 Tax=Streptomyces sp. NBC_01353 TaxID=2903835 RepID=UPI002E358A37|nr:helicase associated domain-containing protein [Streptomyces sp. NBC_01353]
MLRVGEQEGARPPCSATWQQRVLVGPLRHRRKQGHLATPVDHNDPETGFALGRWLATQRKRADQLTPARTKALEELDPHWNPPWPLTWQRMYHVARHHDQTGHTRTAIPRHFQTDNGERLGEWLHTQRTNPPGNPEQLRLLARLNTGATDADIASPPKHSPGARERNFQQGLEALGQFHAREGHLHVPQRHIEELSSGAVRLGQWLSNIRRRWDRLTPERQQALTDTGLTPPHVESLRRVVRPAGSALAVAHARDGLGDA